MGTIADKLNKLLSTKTAIKAAITGKGVVVSDSDTFASYPAKIEAIPTGGIILEPLSNPVTAPYLDSSKQAYNDQGELIQGTGKTLKFMEYGEMMCTQLYTPVPLYESVWNSVPWSSSTYACFKSPINNIPTNRITRLDGGYTMGINRDTGEALTTFFQMQGNQVIASHFAGNKVIFEKLSTTVTNGQFFLCGINKKSYNWSSAIYNIVVEN